MTNPELINYIKGQIQVGTLEAKIKADLLANGWTSADINEAIKLIAAPTTSPIAPSITTPKPVSPPTESKKGMSLILLIVITLLILGGIVVYKAYQLTSTSDTEVNSKINPASTNEDVEVINI